MLNAASHAEKSGASRIAEAIRNEMIGYGSLGKSVEYKKYTVEDFVDSAIEKNPAMSYEELTKVGAKYFGHSTAKFRRDHGPMIRSRMRVTQVN